MLDRDPVERSGLVGPGELRLVALHELEHREPRHRGIWPRGIRRLAPRTHAGVSNTPSCFDASGPQTTAARSIVQPWTRAELKAGALTYPGRPIAGSSPALSHVALETK